jgi:hypothetical protein
MVDAGELRLLEYRNWQECQRVGAELDEQGATIRVGF